MSHESKKIELSVHNLCSLNYIGDNIFLITLHLLFHKECLPRKVSTLTSHHKIEEKGTNDPNYRGESEGT